MVIYTRLESKDELNQFYLMAKSFTKYHPDRILYCLTDLTDLTPIDGVFYLESDTNINEYGDYICYASPYLCFMDDISSFLDIEFKGNVYPNPRKEIKEDFFITSMQYPDQQEEGENLGLNFSIPPYIDSGSIIDFRKRSTRAPVVNTREFEPWKEQRNSYKTLIFPWERYYNELLDAESVLDKEFVDTAISSGQKYSHMLFYLITGTFRYDF